MLTTIHTILNPKLLNWRKLHLLRSMQLQEKMITRKIPINFLDYYYYYYYTMQHQEISMFPKKTQNFHNLGLLS